MFALLLEELLRGVIFSALNGTSVVQADRWDGPPFLLCSAMETNCPGSFVKGWESTR
jgi:hypothetical protein